MPEFPKPEPDRTPDAPVDTGGLEEPAQPLQTDEQIATNYPHVTKMLREGGAGAPEYSLADDFGSLHTAATEDGVKLLEAALDISERSQQGKAVDPREVMLAAMVIDDHNRLADRERAKIEARDTSVERLREAGGISVSAAEATGEKPSGTTDTGLDQATIRALLQNLRGAAQAEPSSDDHQSATRRLPERPEAPAAPEAPDLMDGRSLVRGIGTALAGAGVEGAYTDDVEVEELLPGRFIDASDYDEKYVRPGAAATGDIGAEANLEATNRSEGGEDEGSGPMARALTRRSTPDALPRVALPEHQQEVRPITSWNSGPKRLLHRLGETVYETDAAAAETEQMPPTQAAPMAVAANLFGERASALLRDGERDATDRFRVSFLGSGPGTDAAFFLAELQASHPEIYAHTTAEVSDFFLEQAKAASASPQLLEHMENGSGVEVNFARRDAQLPHYLPDEVPDLVVAVDVLSAFPARKISLNDNEYSPNNPQEVIGKLEEPALCDTVWVDGIAGAQPLVHIDPETAQVQTHPVAALGRSTYLNQLKDRDTVAALLPALMGRIVTGEGNYEPNMPTPIVQDVTRARFEEDWDPDEIAAMQQFVDAPDGVTRATDLRVRRHYNFAPGMTTFIEGTIGHPDRREGMMVFIVDAVRTKTSGDVRGSVPPREDEPVTGLTGVNHYHGAVTSSTVEGWHVAELARSRGAHIRYSSGAQGDMHVMLVDADADIVRALQTENGLTEGLLGIGTDVTAEYKRVWKETANCIATALSSFRPGEPAQLKYATTEVERIYNSIEHPSVKRDHVLISEIAEQCNDAKLYQLGELFGQRAIALAAHTSVNSYRAVARAQSAQGDVVSATETLEAATRVSTKNAAVWSELKVLYRAQPERVGDFVYAAMQYVNTARNLSSRQITELLVELCEAQERYADQERDNTDPYTIVKARIVATAMPVAGPDGEYTYRAQVDRTPTALPTNRQLNGRTFQLYQTALETAQMLASIRHAEPDDRQERITRQQIERLVRGLRRAQEAGRTAPFATTTRNPYEQRQVYGHVGGQPLAPTAYLGGLEDDDERPEIQPRLVSEADVLGSDLDVVEVVDEQSPAERNRRYTTALHVSLGIQPNSSPVDILEAGRQLWHKIQEIADSMPETEDTTSIIRSRNIILELLSGRQITGAHLREMRAPLRAMLQEGGDFNSMLQQLAIFRQEIIAQEQSAAQ